MAVATSDFGFGGGPLYSHPAAAAAENGRDYYVPELSQPDHIAAAAAAASASGAVSSPAAVKANFHTDRGRDRKSLNGKTAAGLQKRKEGRRMPLPATTK